MYTHICLQIWENVFDNMVKLFIISAWIFIQLQKDFLRVIYTTGVSNTIISSWKHNLSSFHKYLLLVGRESKVFAYVT